MYFTSHESAKRHEHCLSDIRNIFSAEFSCQSGKNTGQSALFVHLRSDYEAR